MCHTGCVHVTFNHVTLDLCRGQFEPFAALVQNLEPQRDRVLLEYGHALLRFTGEQFAEFRGMVAAAREEYQRLEVVRRLLA